MAIADCHQIDFPKIHDPRGNLTFVEADRHIPFEIKRVYYLYDVPAGETRAGHAHKELQQVLVAISGSFDVLLDDGREKKRVRLDRPYFGFYIYPMTWRVLENFSSGSVCLSIVSEYYAESDYYRNYSEFIKAVGENK
jgi:oxalate decarboxylase/phosphoglucose isomerase-like protein (cupin superfamily)